MPEHRILQGTTRLDFTCQNRVFHTDIDKGYIHRAGHTHKGSVTQNPLYDDASGYSLWLEWVTNTNTGDSVLWFMWYNNGVPVIPLSGIINEANIAEVIRNISQIKF